MENKHNTRGYSWVIGGIVLITLAQLLLKWAMVNIPLMSISDINFVFLTHHYTQLCTVIFGLLGYALSMLCWLCALRYLPLNQAYPLISISYVLVYLLAVAWFNETATVTKTLGALFILLGVWIIYTKPKKLG